jgi:hypothetical protein
MVSWRLGKPICLGINHRAVHLTHRPGISDVGRAEGRETN